ncbi:MAG: M14 family zinc carboxypeptidase [Flavobacteriales bacterium]|nr:M14 family zinc carboxypeptidase [Flavobacteriales bacterium]MCX7768872.1 M14 family zinc carboxypeptidase [Flavobacteriales bacterium]MDW8410315.1 M14 family zinc carboxypeptidase [Flavobacteriales bacterium]
MRKNISLLLLLLEAGSTVGQPYRFGLASIEPTDSIFSVITQAGLLDCGVEYRPGVGLWGYFPVQVISQLPPSKFIEFSMPPFSNAKSSGTECEKIKFPYVFSFELGSMGGFYTLEQVDTQFMQLQQYFPQYVSPAYTVPGVTTHQGRPLKYYRISDNSTVDEDERAIFYGGAIHAREPLSVSSIVYFLRYLLENVNTNPLIKFLLDNTEIYVMPIINPDGYYYNQTTYPMGGGMWRKNMRNNGDGTFGVDLNRNFPYAWGWDDLGSSPDPASYTYRGPAPASEPEVQAVMWLMTQEKFHYSLMHHTYGNWLIHPWGYIDQNCPDSTRFKASASFMVKQNNFTYGTTAQTVGYLANGNSDDYAYADVSYNKPSILGLTPETGTYYDGFWPIQDRIEPLCRQNLWLNLAPLLLLYPILWHDLKPPYILPAGQVVNIPFTLTRHSDSNAVFVRTFTSLSPLITIPAAQAVRQIVHPPLMSPLPDTLPLHVAANVPQGATVQVVVSISNGFFTLRDTFLFALGTPDTVFRTSCDISSLETFSTNSNWNYTNEQFVSPPTSLTDSPGTNYMSEANQEIVFDKIINLNNATAAELSYKARWSTEKRFDGVVPFARLLDGTEVPLCGYYTYPFFFAPPSGNPLVYSAYDGEQNGWVDEFINLSLMLGSKFRLGFRLFADDYGGEKDGFYVDDIRIVQLKFSNSENESGLSDIEIYPNPAEDVLYVDVPESFISNLAFGELCDITGRPVLHQRLSSPHNTFQISDLPAGLYILFIELNHEKRYLFKISIR